MYKNYIFDLYGTLIDIKTDEESQLLWEKMALIYGYRGAYYEPEQLHRLYRKYVQEEIDVALKRWPNFPYPDIKIETVFKRLFEEKNVRVTSRDIAETCAFFRCISTEHIALYDGVIDLLDSLKAKGKKIYLITNAQRGFTMNELIKFNLIDYFEDIVISSDRHYSKPDKRLIQIFFRRNAIEKSESIMIGNDAICDIKFAHDFGIDTLYIHQDISPEIKGELLADYTVMDGDVSKIKELILK